MFMQVTGVIDIQRNKDKGYETLVKHGFCDEVMILVGCVIYIETHNWYNSFSLLVFFFSEKGIKQIYNRHQKGSSANR